MSENTYKYRSFLKDLHTFRKMSSKEDRFSILWADVKPILNEKTSGMNFDTHYIYHTAWAARVVANIKPRKHIDLSSSLFFSGIISAFIPTEFYDYRPANIKLDNFSSGKADLLSLPFQDGSVESLSCLHVVEHVGLGRYGDPLDPTGDLKAFKEISRVVAKGGNFIFAVPMGKPRICFNAHRIYSYDQIVSAFDQFEIKEFSLIPDNAKKIGMIDNAPPEQVNSQRYGCGCFWFVKK